jgi:ABC-type sugar transport system ATPase subunit
MDPGAIMNARVGGSSQHVALRDASKSFGGVQALRHVEIEVHHGEVRGLVGENGAGKSTLSRVIAGLVALDSGELQVNGEKASFTSPRDALRHGITMMTQEISLVPQRSVVENVFLGFESSRFRLVDRQALTSRFALLNDEASFDLNPNALVGSLRLGDQQKVEILRALARNAELLIMDEPTAALSRSEAQALFAVIKRLRERGTTIIYVTHFLTEVLALADSVTVMKDGRIVDTRPASDQSPKGLVTAMLGRSLEMAFPPKNPPAYPREVAMSVRGLSRGRLVHDVSFDLHRGEIVGLAGLVGAGRTELARAIFGADPVDAGTISIDGRLIPMSGPAAAIRHGIAMLPESRKTQGLIMSRPVIENVSLPHLREVSAAGLVKRDAERTRVRRALADVGVDVGRMQLPVFMLSGGNQQKTLFAKWIFKTPRVLLADEPTRGVDVGAKLGIYRLIHEAAAAGMAVLMISSELEELLGLAHRILVMRLGRMVGEFPAEARAEHDIMVAAFGADTAAETA